MASNKLEYVLSLKDQFTKGLKGAADETAKLDSNMNRMQNGINKVGGLIAGAFAIDKIKDFGQAVFQSLDNYQKFHASLKTMLKGNEDQAKALESQLVNLAKTTPFELKDVQDATKQLMAYGFKAGDVVDTMRRLGDVSAGIGQPIGEIAYLYGTLKTSGRVTLTDLKQFAGRGIPIYETLAKRLKTTTENINKMASDGKLAFSDIEGAFKDMTKEGGQFFNLMEDQSKTVGGQWSNLSDTWEQIRVNIGKSQTGIIAGTLSFLNKMSEEINESLNIENELDEAFSKKGLKSVTGFWENFKSHFTFSDELINIRGFQNEIKKVSDWAMKENTTSALTGSMAGLQRVKKNTLKKYGAGDLDKTTADRQLAIIDYYMSTMQGAVKNITSKESTTTTTTTTTEGGDLTGETKKTKTLGTGVEVSSHRPQALTINIDKLIEKFDVQATSMTESVSRVREMVTKVLLEAVNDANLAIR